MGGSPSLCQRLVPGEPVVVMGPTGTQRKSQNETVCLVGGGLGNAVLFSIARRSKQTDRRCCISPAAATDVFRQDMIEAHTDEVVLRRAAPPRCRCVPAPARRQSCLSATSCRLLAYAKGAAGPPRFDLQQVSRFIVIGSDRMMAAVGRLGAHPA